MIVWNEGHLPDDMTFEDLKKKHSSRPHNPILASAFFKGGLIEAWGRGTLKIVDECKKAGLPEPDIEKNSGGISVTIYKNVYSEKQLKEKGLSQTSSKSEFTPNFPKLGCNFRLSGEHQYKSISVI
jgi:ATP-dependent DNA helicase RecG